MVWNHPMDFRRHLLLGFHGEFQAALEIHDFGQSKVKQWQSY